MKQIIIIIERSNDGTFCAYGKNVEGIYGMADTVKEAKQSAICGLNNFIKYNKSKNLPNILKEEFQIKFQFDVQSFFDYYKGIFTNAGLEKLTGINQRQIQHYSTGHRKPRPVQVKKIESALHDLGRELLMLEL